MNHPEITLILARATNGVIGFEGRIPWHLPADLRRFKQLTMGAPMIMGRKTFDSLPGLLPGRRHIVITRSPSFDAEGAEAVTNLEMALKTANAPHVWVIGGAEIYQLFLPIADRIELTEVRVAPEGDAIVAPFGGDWQEAGRIANPAQGDAPAFDWITLTRR